MAVRLPSFAGATGWLNSEPLGPAELRGRVVLVHFWTWTCINWLRQQPYVRAWADAYREDGLVVIGVHTPEFSFERDGDGVRRAIEARAIDYPVAVDNGYEVWSAFANRYWPALYFADRDGVLRDEHFGEGRYEGSERTIQRLLGVEREPVTVRPEGVEAAADWEHLHSPETYLGQARGERRVDAQADRLRLNDWTPAGDWTTEPERLALDRAGGSVAHRFHARDAHLVMAPGTHGPIPFRVRLDGDPPGASAGVDVDAAGSGVLEHGRMYNLVRQPAARERTLEVTFLEPGAQAYAFTFG